MNKSRNPVPPHMVGRIYSVYCKDFVSYDEITYYPKEYLNVLTGPNGTGKSTIVSAIILGLGGDPQLLDRSSSISDYIKCDKHSAILTITIFGREKNGKEVFKRTIGQNGQSQFFVNSKDLSKAKFLQYVASYNIQVSNLCQFLPQDRVQDFSKMNPQELLVNTISSVCDDELTQNFTELKNLRAKLLNAHADRSVDRDVLKNEQNRLEQLQVTVNQYQEREEIVQKINVHKANQLWTKVTMAKTKVDQLKTQLKAAQASHKTHNKEFESQKKAQLEISQKTAEFRNTTLEQVSLLTRSAATQRNLESEMDNIIHQVNERKLDLERNKQQATKSKNEVDQIMQLVETKKHELDQFNQHKSIVLKDLDMQKRKIDKTRETAMSQYNKRRELEAKLNDDKIPEITALVHKIERLQNIKTQKIEELKRHQPNLVRAMSWVAENKHKYRSNIYDPMVFELNIKSPEGAMYLENVIRQRDLFAFSCEDKNDMSDLINELCVKQKLSVNVLYCAPAARCLYNSSVPISEIAPLGFTSFLLDLVSGPIPIINKLCAMYHIHNIPIGGDGVGNNTSNIPNSIRVFFGGTKKFMLTASRYRADLILTESTIHRKNQLITVDSSQLILLKDRHAKCVFEKDQIRNNLVEVDNEFERLQIVLREEGDKKRKIEQKLGHYEKLDSEVKKLLEKVNNINKSFSSLDALQATFNKNLLSDFKKIFQIESQLCKNLESTEKFLTNKKINQIMEQFHKQQHESQINYLKECEEQLKSSSDEVERIERSLVSQMKDIDTKTEDVRRLCNGQLPTHKDFAFKSEFKELLKLDLDQIREAISEYQARLDCMRNVNAQEIEDFNQLKEQVEQLKNKIEHQVNEEKNVETKISKLFDSWEPRLNNLIETINTKFGEFMESIQYVGEVLLSRNDIHDFNSYGIQIMVQYRKGAKLQTLDKYIQSGGERAVAIAIYSLSLQHVTSVPFRCVDEINQGMDATNERNIFDLLLKEATKDGSAQYLFVTPKLLSDLSYNERLCVSIVHNSGSMKANAKFPLT